MKLTSLLPWLGSKRTMAPEIVNQLGEHLFYFELCCGSMAVLLRKEPSHHESAVDLHGGLTNLGWVVQQQSTAYELFNELQRVSYNDEIYEASREWLAAFEASSSEEFSSPRVSWAYHYFIASWMGRNGVAGTQRVNYQIATRWTAGGGSGPLRWKNAVDSIPAWWERLRNVHILRRSIFDVVPNIEGAAKAATCATSPKLTMFASRRSCADLLRPGWS